MLCATLSSLGAQGCEHVIMQQALRQAEQIVGNHLDDLKYREDSAAIKGP